MADQAALQEAIQRARQLAAKISQSAPTAAKRPASEMDDHSIGTVKVTLAYEKPANSDSAKYNINRPSTNRDNNNYFNNNKDSDYSRDRDRDKDSAYSGSNNGSNSYSRSNNTNSPAPGHSMLSGAYAGGNSYSSGSADDRIEIIIPQAVIGLVIGKGGENIKRIQSETGATVRVDPSTVDEKGNKVCTITGTKQAVEDAHNQVSSVIENAATNKRPRTQADGSDQYRMKTPGSSYNSRGGFANSPAPGQSMLGGAYAGGNSYSSGSADDRIEIIIPQAVIGLVIGKGGENIKRIQSESGATVRVDPSTADEKGNKVCTITGTKQAVEDAHNQVSSVIKNAATNKRARTQPEGSSDQYRMKIPATATTAAAVAGQQNSADMSAAWAAYFAQYSNLYNQAGAQPGAAATLTQPQPLQPPQPPQPSQQQGEPGAPQAAQQQDYTEQWVEYYILNGRPDFAETLIQMKKQQQSNL